MANSPQSAKRARQSVKRRLRGQALRSQYRTAAKKTRAAAVAGDNPAAVAAFRAFQTVADRLADRGIVHANAAARLKSRLNAAVKKSAQSGSAKTEAVPAKTEAVPVSAKAESVPAKTESVPAKAKSGSTESESVPTKSESVPPESESVPPESESSPTESESSPAESRPSGDGAEKAA